MEKKDYKTVINEYKSYVKEFNEVIKNYPVLYSVWRSKPRMKPRMLCMTKNYPEEWTKFLNDNPRLKKFFENPKISKNFIKATVEAKKYLNELYTPKNIWMKSEYIDADVFPERYPEKEIWDRWDIIPMRCLHNSVYVYNGRNYQRLFIDMPMIGRKFGDFIPCRKLVNKIRSTKNVKKKSKKR